MEVNLKKHEYYFWSLVLLNLFIVIAFIFIVLFNQYPILYELFIKAFGGSQQQVISVEAYAKAFLLRNILASFLLAFPLGYIFKLSCENNKKGDKNG